MQQTPNFEVSQSTFSLNYEFRPTIANSRFLSPKTKKKSVKFSHFSCFSRNSRLYSRSYQQHQTRIMKMTKTPCHTKIIPKSKKKARIFAQFPSKIADIAQNPNIVNPHNTSPIPINSSRFCLEPATHNPKTAEFRSKIRQICLKFNQYRSNTVEYCRNPYFHVKMIPFAFKDGKRRKHHLSTATTTTEAQKSAEKTRDKEPEEREKENPEKKKIFSFIIFLFTI